MGMSTHITGFKSEDSDLYQKHLRVFHACKDAEVSLPAETADYFSSGFPCDSFLEDALEEVLEVDMGESATEWSDDHRSGFEVVVKDIPADVDVIRFYNSY